VLEKICQNNADEVHSENRKEKIAMLEIGIFLEILKEEFELWRLGNDNGSGASKTCMSVVDIVDLSDSFPSSFEGQEGFDQEIMIEDVYRKH